MSYQPINCSFYDLLEQAATLGTGCEITHIGENGASVAVRGKIDDLHIKDQVEYLRLHSGQEIRLDQLIDFNGIALKGFDGTKKK